jgi:hypothetical protein
MSEYMTHLACLVYFTFVTDSHISYIDFAQFCGIIYTHSDEPSKEDTQWRWRRSSVGMLVPSSGGSFIKGKQWMLPDVPVRGQYCTEAIRGGYSTVYLNGISSRCVWHGAVCVGDGAAGGPRGQELQNNMHNNSNILSQYKEGRRS